MTALPEDSFSPRKILLEAPTFLLLTNNFILLSLAQKCFFILTVLSLELLSIIMCSYDIFGNLDLMKPLIVFMHSWIEPYSL